MKKNNIIYFIFGLMVTILIWEIVSFFAGQNVFPDFFFSFGNMFKILFTTNLIIDILYSLLRVIISFIIGSIIGISLGLISGLNKKSEYAFLPIMTIIKTIPTISIILLLMIYFKYSYIYVLILLVLPIVYHATAHEIYLNSQKYKDIFQIRNRKVDLYSVFRVLIPASSSQIINSFIQSFSLCLKAQVLVESFAYTSTFRGIGKIIYLSFINNNINTMISLIMFIIISSILIDLALTKIKKIIIAKTM